MIERVRTYKYLGICLEDTLKFDARVAKASWKEKVRSGMAVLSRMKHLSRVAKRKSLFAALEPHLAYMVSIHGCTLQEHGRATHTMPELLPIFE